MKFIYSSLLILLVAVGVSTSAVAEKNATAKNGCQSAATVDKYTDLYRSTIVLCAGGKATVDLTTENHAYRGLFCKALEGKPGNITFHAQGPQVVLNGNLNGTYSADIVSYCNMGGIPLKLQTGGTAIGTTLHITNNSKGPVCLGRCSFK